MSETAEPLIAGETRTEFLADMETMVQNAVHVTLAEVEEQHRAAEAAKTRRQGIADVILLPSGIGLIIILLALHCSGLCEAATMTPSFGYMIIRLLKKPL